MVNIESASTDQILVDDGVKPAVVNNVIDVPVDVVIHPASGDGEKVLEVGASHAGIVRAACRDQSLLHKPLIKQFNPVLHLQMGTTLQMRHASNIGRRNLCRRTDRERLELA